MRPIEEIAAAAGITADALELYGRYKAKIDPAKLTRSRRAPRVRAPGKVVLVSAMSPTPAGEGKSTTTVGLARFPGPGRAQRDDRAARTLARPRSWA